MRRKKILMPVVIRDPNGTIKLTLILTKEIYLSLLMLLIFGWIFIPEATAQASLQAKIIATSTQPATDEENQNEQGSLSSPPKSLDR